MIRFCEYLFWISVVLILYPYIVFPVLVLLRGWLFHRPCKLASIEPRISLIIAAHNESDTIAEKLGNALSLDYPCDRLEVIVASDGSTDGTEEIVRQYTRRGVRLLSLPRRGKAWALNAAIAESRGDVLVFTDATSIFSPTALRHLVRPLTDPRIGGVAGNMAYRKKRNASLVEDGEQLHSGLDRKLKQAASRAGHAISASGAIYAIRRELMQEVPEGVTDDFVISTRVISQGYRLVFASEAIAYDPAAKSNLAEFGRKVRVITRGFRSVFVMRELFNPWRYGFYSVQLFSHKVMRRLVALPLLLVFALAPLLWHRGLPYQVASLLQLCIYGLAACGFILRGTSVGKLKIFSIPFYFCLVNVAALIAAVNVLRRRRIVLWEPQRPDKDAGTLVSGVTH